MKVVDIEAIRTLDPNAVFAVAETARLLNMTHNGILNRIKSGKLRAGKNGGRYFIQGMDIQNQIIMPEDKINTTVAKL